MDAAGRVPVRLFRHGVGTSLIYGRYLLPMLPFVCLLAAIAVVSGVSLLRRFDIPRPPRRLLIAGPDDRGAAAAAGQLDRVRSRHQRDQHAAGRVALDPQNIPPGSRIAIEKYDIRLPDSVAKARARPAADGPDHEEYVRQGYEYIIASSQVFGPVFEAPQQLPDLYAKIPAAVRSVAGGVRGEAEKAGGAAPSCASTA